MQTNKPYPTEGMMIDGYEYSDPITFEPQYGWLASGQFPVACIQECSASGQVDNAVEYWCNKLRFTSALEPVRSLAERYLKEFGAWDDLATCSIETLAYRILWTACCDISEQGEWLGLVH
jgi:hypothetical protein